MLIPEWLYLFLLTVGITVIAVLLYLRRKWHVFMRALKQIQQLNEITERDLIHFLDSLFVCLTPLAICGLKWRLHWFGQVIEREQGKKSHYVHTFEVIESEASLQFTFYVTSARWEQAFYFELLRQQLRALCALDLALKMRQVTSFEQGIARYQMFLAHDLKNLAQMMVLWQNQVQATAVNDAVSALQRWQAVAPLMADRAALLAKRLTAPGDMNNTQDVNLIAIPLSELFARLLRWAQVHGVILHIEQNISDVLIWGEWTALDDAAFQLMRNYQQHADALQAVSLVMEQRTDKLELVFCHPKSIDEATFKRMQEPLWTSSEQGLGLGLWQMGQVLQRINGALKLEHNTQGSINFIWQLSFARSL